jgi:hypothetical protein
MIVAVSTNVHRLFFSPKENLTKHRNPNKDLLHNPPLLYEETTLHFRVFLLWGIFNQVRRVMLIAFGKPLKTTRINQANLTLDTIPA